MASMISENNLTVKVIIQYAQGYESIRSNLLKITENEIRMFLPFNRPELGSHLYLIGEPLFAFCSSMPHYQNRSFFLSSLYRFLGNSGSLLFLVLLAALFDFKPGIEASWLNSRTHGDCLLQELLAWL